jgi:hypothetical protein
VKCAQHQHLWKAHNISETRNKSCDVIASLKPASQTCVRHGKRSTQQIGAAQRDSILLYRTSGQKWNHVNLSGEKYNFHYCKYDRNKSYGTHSSYAKPPIPAKEEDSHKHNLIALLDAKTHTVRSCAKKHGEKGILKIPRRRAYSESWGSALKSLRRLGGEGRWSVFLTSKKTIQNW